MATCKDCIYYEKCKSLRADFADSADPSHTCYLFKDKANYAEVKHAEWVDDGFGRGNMICSGCGQYPVDDEDGNPLSALAWWQPEYCPNCGARMDGRSDINEVSSQKDS